MLLDGAQFVGLFHGQRVGAVLNAHPFGEVQTVGNNAQRGVFQYLHVLVAHVVTQFSAIVVQRHHHLSVG